MMTKTMSPLLVCDQGVLKPMKKPDWNIKNPFAAPAQQKHSLHPLSAFDPVSLKLHLWRKR